MTPEDWIKAGYKKYPSPHNNADFLLQKCVRYNSGKEKYYIDTYAYDRLKYPTNTQTNGWGFAPEMAPHNASVDDSVTGAVVQLNLAPDATIADVECAMDKFWELTGTPEIVTEGEMK
jgi:hypothetical protein